MKIYRLVLTIKGGAYIDRFLGEWVDRTTIIRFVKEAKQDPNVIGIRVEHIVDVTGEFCPT